MCATTINSVRSIRRQRANVYRRCLCRRISTYIPRIATAHRRWSVHSAPEWVALPVFPAWLGPAITSYTHSAARSSRPFAAQRSTTLAAVATYFTVARRPQINAWLYNVEIVRRRFTTERHAMRGGRATTQFLPRMFAVGGPNRAEPSANQCRGSNEHWTPYTISIRSQCVLRDHWTGDLSASLSQPHGCCHCHSQRNILL